MPYITVGNENSAPIEVYYEDHGAGRPVVLIHGFPLDGRAWERQERALIAAGHRVITYDRRGFGKSGPPVAGYDYDTFAADLDKLVTALDLRGFDLAGHSMGGGEIARYFGGYGSDRVRRAAIISGIPPFLLKTSETPQGVPQETFDQIAGALTADRFAYFTEWNKDFFNLDQTLGTRNSRRLCGTHGTPPSAPRLPGRSRAWRPGTPTSAPTCPRLTFRSRHARHRRRSCPWRLRRAYPRTLADSDYVAVDGAGHGLCWTHAEEVYAHLVPFLR